MDKNSCCPKFDPNKWDQKETTWKDKLFVKDSNFAIFHVPVNLGSVLKRMSKKINAADASYPSTEYLILSHDPSLWKTEQYVAVTKEVPDMENIKLSGTYLTKVFEGPYSEARNWVNEIQEYVVAKGKEIKKLYFFYTTCPKCAKEQGKNYVVAFAQV